MSPLCVGRMMPWLRNAVLCGKLPPAGSAGSFLACRHRVHVQRCVNHSDSQEGHGPAAPIPTRPARPLGNRRSLSPLDRDMTAMMMMMDVSPGDVVLEAGSGSGALSLFLSRAVGSEGCVHSFEVRADHHAIAKNNFLKWKNGWQTRCGQPWPDNVQFINRNVLDTLPDYKSVAFDAAALDMLNPHVALPAIIENLKQGAVCAVYIANITQVIDLLEGIRCCELPLLCEKVVEVKITDWLVAPSFRKDGSISKRVGPKLTLPPENQILEETDDDDDDDEESQTDEDLELPTKDQPFGQMPYIARPLPWQTGHTAFLVQLRKFKPAPEHTGTGDHS
ncbi:tRNA (adenine(58)-N(1))-methyltransferase, mitochondrial isoform X2 [Mixophyes fleayi]|uniref:tRNA (adenine(58)-N(1))-methyltransferase, mitochondrial isoform X2 n=1 Tax=Mixophyes fleayi TaxID=3061075 RepID=UPI003F4E1DB8